MIEITTRFYPVRTLIFFGFLSIISFTSCTNGDNGNNRSDTVNVQSLLNKAAAQQATDEKIAQLYFLDSALAGKELNINEQIRIFDFKCDVYLNQLRNHEKATAIADSMITLVEANDPEKHSTEYAIANYRKGDILFTQKNYNEAYTYYYKAREIGKATLDSCTLGEYSFRLALILFRQARYKEAAERFDRTFDELSACNFDFPGYFRLQQVLNNIGLSYFRTGNNDSAFFHYQKALDFIAGNRGKFRDRQYLSDVANAVILGNLADVYKAKGDTSYAKNLLKQSILINTKQGHDNMDAQYSQVKLADIYGHENYFDSMYAVLKQLKTGLDIVPNAKAEMDWNRLMWKYYNTQNDSQKAFEHLTQFTALRDSLEKETNKLISADLSQQIQIMEDQYEIAALKKDNELKNMYLWIFILASVLTLVIIYFVSKNLKKSRKNVALLQSLNIQVNEQKQQIEQALASLEEKNKQQDRIMKAVAHDLRGPVATISMLSDLILAEQDQASRAEMIGFIKTSCNNSLILIAEILEAAEQSKKTEQEKESTNINQLIKTTVELLQLKASEKDQKITLHLPQQHLFLMINPEKIKRVLNNLITNAIKFSDKGEEIKVSLTKDDKANTIIVEDNGIGIPENIQSKVFDMFTEAKRKGTAGELPYGLGLSICKQIVEAHNGRIWFETKQDKGTIFYVELP